MQMTQIAQIARMSGAIERRRPAGWLGLWPSATDGDAQNA
jgi:hypothetical protein